MVSATVLIVLVIAKVTVTVSGSERAVASLSIDPMTGQQVTVYVDPTTRRPLSKSLVVVTRSTNNLFWPLGAVAALVLGVSLFSLRGPRRANQSSLSFGGETQVNTPEALRKAAAVMSGALVADLEAQVKKALGDVPTSVGGSQEKLSTLVSIIETLAKYDVTGSDAKEWLASANPSLGNKSPLDLVTAGKGDIVLRRFGRIAHGIL